MIKGNPDGTFRPDALVSRAAFLTMLYRMTGRQPAATQGACFRDVEKGSWYESIVCDAASKTNGFVQGFQDGTFRPADPVSRTQALKMIFMVLGLPVPPVTSADKDIIKFTDLSVSAWYSAYISGAYHSGILPIFGIGGARFEPEKRVVRAEAAGLLWNAQAVHATPPVTPSPEAGTSTSQAASDSSDLKTVSFPFTDTSVFVAKKPRAYLFSLSGQRTIVSVTAIVTDKNDASVTCRLYRLGADDFSTEYYLGFQEGSRCRIVAAVPAGNYQLQLQPSRADVSYTVDASTVASDGNDGFIDAQPLTLGSSVAGTLDPTNDFYDWYTFTVTGQRDGTVFASAGVPLSCIVYVPSDVDLFGFKVPECGLQFTYPSGTYIVGVGRASGADMSKSTAYTVQWR